MTEAKTKSSNYIVYMIVIVVAGVCLSSSKDVFQIMISAAVCGGLFASLCMTKCKVWTIAPTVVAVPLVIYLMTGSINYSVLSLSFIPVGLTVYYGIRKKLSRMQTVVRAISVMLLFYGCVYGAYIVNLYGTFNRETISKFVQLNLDLFKQYYELMREFYIANGVDVKELFTDELLVQVTESMRVMWFGYTLALFGALSYLSTVIVKSLCKKENGFPKECVEWKLVLSKPGAIIFVLAYIAGSLYSYKTEGLYLAFAINSICVGIGPAVLYMGVSHIWAKMRSAKKMSFLISALIGLAIFGQYVILLLLIIGIYATLTYENKTQSDPISKQ